VFICSRIKKAESRDPAGKKCHTKTMMSRKAGQSAKINTKHVPLRQNAEEKERGNGLEAVYMEHLERMKRVVKFIIKR
jgi:hypothetical protein